MKRLVTSSVLLLCVVALLPASVRAQDDGHRSDSQLSIDLERSEQLHSQAFQNEIDQKNWARAANLYVESASLRPYGDIKAYLALDRAGKLFSHSGKVRDAHEAFATAGMRALETGHVYEAAMAFANAADISQQNARDVRFGPDYLETVYRLIEHPSLTADQKKMIGQRLGLDGG